jgi:hypothetical protein
MIMMRFQGLWLVVLALCLVACHEKTTEEAVKESLKVAMEALERGDYDGYLRHVDFDGPMDSTQRAFMKDALRQHQEWKRTERPAVVSVDVIDVQFKGDSICTAYSRYTFADSTKEVVSHKMVRQGESWKIRLRN